MLATPPAPRCVYVFSRKKHWLDETKGENVKKRLQPDTSTTPLPMRYASMGYTSIGFSSMGFSSMGYTSRKLLNFTVFIDIMNIL
jgi:hypothetical protein